MANDRFGSEKAPRRRGRGYVWLALALLAVGFLGVRLEHTSNPVPLNGVLSSQTHPQHTNNQNQGNQNQGHNNQGNNNQANNKNKGGGDDANHTKSDGDCDSAIDGYNASNPSASTCTPKGNHKPPPPPHCNQKDNDDQHGEGSKQDHDHQGPKQCQISGQD